MTILSLEDKYVLLQAENARLRRQLSNAFESLKYYKEHSLEREAERDHYWEQAQEVDEDAY